MSEDNSGIKSIIVLLVILALVVAFILFMRHQDIKKELQAEKNKMEQEARALAEKKEREERDLRETERRREEERKRENELREAERKREEERERERIRHEAERKREEEREKYESIVREKQNRISSLKRQLEEVNNNYVPPESKYISKEVADIDRVLNDNTYKCFDFCINFGNIEFYRVMHHYKEDPNSQGYYYTRHPSTYYIERYDKRGRGKRVWHKVYVTYHCNKHGIDWTKDSAESYKQNFIPRSQLESKRNRLKSSLDRIIRARKSKGEEEAIKIKAAISVAEAELADFEKSHRPSQDK